MIYLDNAATTKMDVEVLNAMLPYLTTNYGNPSSVYSAGIYSRIAIEKARKAIADLLGTIPQSVVFTSGGTESNNMAILSSIRDLGCDHIITTRIEHHAVLNTVQYYAETFNIGITYTALNDDGSLNQAAFEASLKEVTAEGKKCLVSLMHANNETGQLTDIARIALICKKYGAVFHSDCVQTIGHYPVNFSTWGVHFASASAHKFHGPKGTGLMYVDPGLKIKPLILGGGQERQLRAGTENVAGIVGMAKALELFYQRFVIDYEHIFDLKKSMTALLGNIFPDIIINGGDQMHYCILSASFPKNEQAESLLMNLNEKGICVAGGSACSGNNDSHVMGELRRTGYYVTIRFSFSRFNTKQDVEQTVGLIKDWLLPRNV